MNRCQVLVIGAGPIGLETAAALQDDGRDVITIDECGIGATIDRTFPPQTRFFTSPERLVLRDAAIPSTDQEKVTGEQYTAYLRAFAATRGLHIDTYQQATAITRSGDGFSVHTSSLGGEPQTYRCEALVLATGGTHQPRRLGAPGEELPHVSHYLRNPGNYYGRRVIVVGGRNSAAESALRLYRVGATVSLVHREPALNDRIKFWIRPEVQALINEGLITAHMPAAVQEIRPDSVRLTHPDTGEQADVPTDDVLLQIGYQQDPAIFVMAGIEIAGPDRAPVHDPQTMETNQPGIYVVGTATAGTQSRFGVFIENCHQHADRVAAALAGRPAPAPIAGRALPEA